MARSKHEGDDPEATVDLKGAQPPTYTREEIEAWRQDAAELGKVRAQLDGTIEGIEAAVVDATAELVAERDALQKALGEASASLQARTKHAQGLAREIAKLKAGREPAPPAAIQPEGDVLNARATEMAGQFIATLRKLGTTNIDRARERLYFLAFKRLIAQG
jgi:septal ring factor EnvC (AmiA/AmiB activator)